MNDSSPATPRSRNAAFTRAAILEAACSRFAQEGYDGASLRDLAADARVDPALICRYFGSKEDLFAEALTSCGPPRDFLPAAKSEFGAQFARMLVLEPWKEAKLNQMLMVLRSISSPRAADIIRANTCETFYQPLERWLDGPDAAVKARAAAAVVMGFAFSRALDDRYMLSDEDREKLAQRLAGLLDATIA